MEIYLRKCYKLTADRSVAWTTRLTLDNLDCISLMNTQDDVGRPSVRGDDDLRKDW